jgi:hypothetical protein
VECVDRKIAALAGRQYGYVKRKQLILLGVGRGAIDHRIDTGKLIVAHAGVYAVGHTPVTPAARAMAAVLACGDGAVLSHGSAAALWGMLKRWEEPIEVTAEADRRRPGIRAHRVATLNRSDVRHHLGIRVTSPARTVLDMTPRLTQKTLTRVVNAGRRSGHLQLGALEELLARTPRGRPGANRLRRIVETAPEVPTRSGLEDGFLAFAQRFGLPRPLVNTQLAGHEVDALFEAERVIVELDGWEYHRDRGAFENDRERDAIALHAGYVTVRITDERFERQPATEAARLHAILRARRPGPG